MQVRANELMQEQNLRKTPSPGGLGRVKIWIAAKELWSPGGSVSPVTA
jgi:hypothetical protein